MLGFEVVGCRAQLRVAGYPPFYEACILARTACTHRTCTCGRTHAGTDADAENNSKTSDTQDCEMMLLRALSVHSIVATNDSLVYCMSPVDHSACAGLVFRDCLLQPLTLNNH